MLTILVSLVAAILVTLGLKLVSPSSTWSLSVPFLGALLGVAFLIVRRVTKLTEPVIEEAQRHLAAGRREPALKALQGGLRLGRWNPLIGGQLRTQIGALYYAMGKLDEAETELAAGSRWPWLGKALLGCVHFKRRDAAKMRKAFAIAVKTAEKESVLWTLYAHCLLTLGEKDEAVKILEAGLKKIPGDQRLENNLELAKEGKKLKTAPYGDKWNQFGLATDGPVVPHAMRGFAARPGFRQRPLRKR